MRNLAKILPLKFKLSGKLQRFNTIYGIIEMLKIVEFLKISFKIKNCETASRLREIMNRESSMSVKENQIDKKEILFFSINI